MNIRHKFQKAVAAALLLFVGQSAATVVLNTTRVIYSQKDKEVVVQVENSGEKPSLLQSWIDDGEKQKKISQIDVPFVIFPPVARIEPGKGQSLRITYTGTELPSDRESVFWLNVLDIPPKAENGSGNEMQMAFRTRVKLFFRPTELDKTTYNDALESVSWRNSGRMEDQHAIIDVINSSPLHVTLSSLDVMNGDKVIETIKGKMIPPFLSESFKLKPSSLNDKNRIVAKFINDYGALTSIDLEKN